MAFADRLKSLAERVKALATPEGPDIATLRANAISRAKASAEKLASGSSRGVKDYYVNNGHVGWTPTIAPGKPIRTKDMEKLDTGAFGYAESTTEFGGLVADWCEEVEKGAYDADLVTAWQAGPGSTIPVTRAPRKAREPRAAGEGGNRPGWSPERRAAFAETIAARKAAKAK